MIKIRGLKKRFRSQDVLRGVDLDIPEGKVTAFLGANGAGKTTTIKCAMNLIPRDAGEISVMAVDTHDLTRQHWQRIAYVSENRSLPNWMTVPKLLDYVRPMYGKFWDRDFERKLLSAFDLPLKTKLGALSRGQRMKAELLSALGYRPQLVVLDEPFSGLDPLVRDELLTGLLELTEMQGWTVWVSSHDIEEVQRFSDRVAILNDGRIALQEDLEDLRHRHRRIELWFDDDVVLPTNLPETWTHVEVVSRAIRFIDTSYHESSSSTVVSSLFPTKPETIVAEMSLREIFVALASGYRAASTVTA
jgi:ABC-2 type transport system ATP-binding protein